MKKGFSDSNPETGIGSHTKNEMRRCTSCLSDFPWINFYSKGDRLDSICKSCSRKKARSRYQTTKARNARKRLDAFVNLMLDLELEQLTEFDQKLDEIIERAKARRQHNSRVAVDALGLNQALEL